MENVPYVFLVLSMETVNDNLSTKIKYKLENFLCCKVMQFPRIICTTAFEVFLEWEVGDFVCLAKTGVQHRQALKGWVSSRGPWY